MEGRGQYGTAIPALPARSRRDRHRTCPAARTGCLERPAPLEGEFQFFLQNNLAVVLHNIRGLVRATVPAVRRTLSAGKQNVLRLVALKLRGLIFGDDVSVWILDDEPLCIPGLQADDANKRDHCR